MNKLTVGADPEVFVADAVTGEIQASQGIVRGTKRRPFKTEHGFIHRDNVLAEMNVEPATSAHRFVNNVTGIMSDLELMLAEHDKVIDISSSHIMGGEYLEHFEATRFGCNANLNCWDIDRVHKPSAFSAGALRTASGHIHIGCQHTSTAAQIKLAKACELHIGLPSILHDKDSRRRELYGIAGSFRPKPYGIEYTVPSNFWLKSPELMEWVYFAVRRAVDAANHTIDIGNVTMERIQGAINTCDETEAKSLCSDFGIDYSTLPDKEEVYGAVSLPSFMDLSA